MSAGPRPSHPSRCRGGKPTSPLLRHTQAPRCRTSGPRTAHTRQGQPEEEGSSPECAQRAVPPEDAARAARQRWKQDPQGHRRQRSRCTYKRGQKSSHHAVHLGHKTACVWGPLLEPKTTESMHVCISCKTHTAHLYDRSYRQTSSQHRRYIQRYLTFRSKRHTRHAYNTYRECSFVCHPQNMMRSRSSCSTRQSDVSRRLVSSHDKGKHVHESNTHTHTAHLYDKSYRQTSTQHR